MVETKNTNWPVALLLCAIMIVSMLVMGLAINNSIEKNADKPINVDLTPVLNAINTNNEKIDVLVSTSSSEVTDATENSRLDSAVNEILKSDDEEKIAEDLAISYIDCKEFKKALMSYLNTLSEDGTDLNIEDYKDISSIVIKDTDVRLRRHGDNANVEFELKITYFNDGDDDTEDAETVRVIVTLSIEELDEDEDYADAEVIEPEEDDFEFVKFYSD